MINCMVIGMRIVFNSFTWMHGHRKSRFLLWCWRNCYCKFPQILFHFPYTFSHFSDLSWIGLDEMRRQIAYWLSLHLILLPLSNSFVSTVMAGVYLNIMLTCFIMRSLVGTATDSQNFNYPYCSRFLIPVVRWWHITAIKAKSCKVPQFRTETGSVGVTT